ncbi:hypothetical protein L7F22_011014 [Adiantum nelumboides]|nr:hypothetical protein [Adiantum nelumboides]
MYSRPVRLSFIAPPLVPRPFLRAHSFPTSHTQPQFIMSASQNICSSPFVSCTNFQPGFHSQPLVSPSSTLPPGHTPLQSQLHTHDEDISDDTWGVIDNHAKNIAPYVGHGKKNNGLRTTTQVEHASKPTSRKRPISPKDKGQENDIASERQTKAKECRQKLADGETATFRGEWSMDDFRVLVDAKLRLDKEMAYARGKNQFLSLDER